MFNINEEIIKGTLSSKISEGIYEKANFKKVMIKGEIYYQFAFLTKTQVFHKNVKKDDLITELTELFKTSFKQMNIVTNNFFYDYKLSKKGTLLTNKRKNNNEVKVENLEHNIKKNYLLEEGQVVEPLVDLKVMLEDGTVVKKYYNKFKQINKFLEIIEDTIKDEKYLNIVDFGCGKSYLTFILYYYLTVVKKIKVDMVGLDLKEDVIDDCNKIKDKYGYENLKFICGDIKSYNPEKKVDMIITLHACNTATDYALYHAINLGCRYIFSSPCCQQEINNQLKKDKLSLMNKYGLIKERFSSLLTDSIRGNILEYFGYKVNIMEFIELEHSMKNILIKGVLTKDIKEDVKEDILDTLKKFGVKHTLVELFKKDNKI